MALCPLIAPSYPQVSAELTGKTHRPDGLSPESGLRVYKATPELLYNDNIMDDLLEAVCVVSN